MIPPTAYPPPMPQPPPPGWWSRHWKWCVPVAVVSLLVLVVGFIPFLLFGVFSMMKSSEPCQKAIAKALASPQIQAELGTPVKDGFFSSGSISTAGSSGKATMDIPISGPKGKGNLHLDATKSAGTWTYSTLEVTIEGKSEKIDLRP